MVYIDTVTQVINPWTRNLAQVRRGTGSGFVWDERGHIVTNYHVIANAGRPSVRLADGRRYDAAVVGASPEHDLAVLRIDVPLSRPVPVPLGDSQQLRVGQKVFAIGNPFGFDHTLTTGIVSALDRAIAGEDGNEIRHLIQTDAAINPGNSGGPLLDSAGRLIGINTAIFSPTGAFSGIGFAVPAATVNRVVPRLIAHGRYVRPRLGIQTDDDVSRAVLKELGIEGVLTLRVEAQSPAARAGLRGTRLTARGDVLPGDVIQSVNGHPVRTMSELIETLDQYQVGEQVTLDIWRDGARQTLAVTLDGEWPQLD